MVSQKIGLLSRVPLFAGLDSPEVEALTGRAAEKRYAAGETLFLEGEPCQGIFLLAEGSVKIYKTSPSGREITLAVEGAPSSVAEVPLFDGGPYPASVSAVTDVLALFIDKRDFQQVCRQHPEVSLKVLNVVGRRLRQLVSIIELVTFGSVRQRLAALLLQLGEQSGQDSFALPLTHQELASHLGTVREVVSRNLSRFQVEGLVRASARQISILDRAGLKREAETEL